MFLLGSYNHPKYVQSEFYFYFCYFKLAQSNDCSNWQTITDSHGAQIVFTGNNDTDTKVYNMLPEAVTTRCFRLMPATWNGHISMRWDVLTTFNSATCTVPPLSNGNYGTSCIEGSTISVGTVCSVVCESNYEESVSNIECIGAGTLDTISPTCTGISCVIILFIHLKFIFKIYINS